MFDSPANLFAGLLFGAIGLAVFSYGKKMAAAKPMIFGVALMAYPYFVSQTWALYGIGTALCVALYLFRD